MTTRNERAILRLVDLLYSCVDAESSWSTFLDAVANHFRADLVGIATNSYLQALNSEVDPTELAKYQTHYLKMNPWHIGHRIYPEGRILLSEEVLPANAYRRTSFYHEWGRKNRVSHAVGGAIRATSAVTVFFSINRGDAQGPYGEEDREVAQLLMPHVQRAVNLYERMTGLNDRAWVLNALAFPMMFVASDGAVRWANEAAEQLLRRAHGLRLRDGKLSAELPDEHAELHKKLREDQRLIAGHVNGYGGWQRITKAGDGSQLSLFLTRLPHKLGRPMGLFETGSGFLVLVAAQAVDANTLMSRVRQSWGLTPAEAALAIEMLESDGLPAAAAKLRISRNTAKTQLSSIFQKAGVRRQSELVRRMLALAVIAPAPGE
jgi:DNA-binding CsgD family transcriptional regulator/PAS domain-containing protein